MATSASAATDWTTCSICLEVFDNPKSLPCIHGFCLKCLERYYKDEVPGEKVPCPLCRKRFKIPSDGLEGLQHHFFIQHLVDARNAASQAAGEMPCQACLEENEGQESDVPSATNYCIDCNESLCDKCSRPHQRTTMKGGPHHLRPLRAELEQELIQLRGSYCDKHKDKQVELYCYECKENICVLCFAVKHRNHNSGEIPEVATSFRPRIEEDDKDILSAISAFRQQSEQTKQNAKACANQVASVEKLVVEAGDAIKRLVDTQVSECLANLQSVKSDSAQQAEIVQEQLQLAKVEMESFHTFSRQLLDKGRPSDVTRAASELHKRATELLDYDVTSAQFCLPHVTFSPADVTQLTSSQLIGRITVINSDPEFRPSASTVARQEDKKDVEQRRQQKDIRRTSVDKVSANLLEQEMRKRQMGQLLHTLPEGNAVRGVTTLDNRLYVLRDKSSQQIEVYDTFSYRLLQRLTVPNLLGAMTDIVACVHNRCLYIGDSDKESVHRVGLKVVWMSRPDVRQWPVNDPPTSLSVTDTHSVLVMCHDVSKIKEFAADGKLLRQLAPNVPSLQHTIQLSSGEFVVSHGDPTDPVHRVCLLGSDGHVVKSYGGPEGSGSQQIQVPAHLAVDRNGFVFVAECNNCRVLLLSPDLNYVREVVSREQLKWKPLRLYLDVDRRRLYVAVNVKVGEFTAGRVVVFNV